MFPGSVKQLACREWYGFGMEDATRDVDERKDKDDLEGVDDVVAYLRGGDIETEDEGDGKAEDGGASKDGIDADEEADGDAPGQLFRRGSHAEKRENGKGNATVDPVVVDGRGDFGDCVVIGWIRLHC